MKLDYSRALKSIIAEESKGNNPVPDILAFRHINKLFGNKIDEAFVLLFSQYLNGSRKVQPLVRMDVPKANFTIRPMARPEIEDWILFEAIVLELANRVISKHTEVCSRSYSIKKYSLREPSTNHWLDFEKKSHQLYDEGFRFAVTTDITGFYENISLEELRRRIFNFVDDNSENRNLIELLFKLLRRWSDERITGYGLPQGPVGSSFLADLFLDNVDRKMEKHEGYFRFMDDIKIFCKREIDAKLALRDLIIALRELKLNINAKKTDLLYEEDIPRKLFDPQSEQMTLIEDILQTKNYDLIEKTALPSLVRLFKAAFENDPLEKRHLNFSLYRLGMLHNSGFSLPVAQIKALIMTHLTSKPHHSNLFCTTLAYLEKENDIAPRLLSFLKSEENIYDWQALKVLQALLRISWKPSQRDIDYLITIAQDHTRPQVCRGFAMLVIGKYGSNRDREMIVDMYRESLDYRDKTTIILAVQELSSASRNDFYGRIKRESDDSLNRFVDYVKSLTNPLYFLVGDRPKIDAYKETYSDDYLNM